MLIILNSVNGNVKATNFIGSATGLSSATPTEGGTVKMRISGSDLFITNNGTNP